MPTEIPELSTREIEPLAGAGARQLIIFLHGYGADGNDLIELAPRFAQVVPEAALLSPDAPYRCGGVPFGYEWYDVWMQDRSARLAAVRRAAAILDHFITRQLEQRGLAEENLVLIGFSQGAMMSLFVAPRRVRPVAGVVGYSGRMEAPELLREEIKSRPPVALIHGDCDELLAVGEMEAAAETLRTNGIETHTHVRPGLGHGIDEEGIRIALAFAGRVLEKPAPKT